MASLNYTPFGVVIELGHSEALAISTHLNTGAATASTITAVLAGMGITGAVSVIVGIASGILGLGSAALAGCNSNSRGVYLTIIWIGMPCWCRSR